MRIFRRGFGLNYGSGNILSVDLDRSVSRRISDTDIEKLVRDKELFILTHIDQEDVVETYEIYQFSTFFKDSAG